MLFLLLLHLHHHFRRFLRCFPRLPEYPPWYPAHHPFLPVLPPEYFLSHGEPVGENPSPGNKAGGISTLEDKALGCTQKCGKAYVDGVMGYGDRLKVKGLNLLSAPGNDLVAATALASCGCHMVLFTTGRGTPFGTFVPTMKISTNSTLAKNKPGWIDFNAGVIVENEPMEKTCERFIDYIIRVASGEPVNNEKKNYREIAIFKTGVTL